MVMSGVPNRPQTRHEATARSPVPRKTRVTQPPAIVVDGLTRQGKDEASNAARAGRFVSTARGPRRYVARPHAGRDGAVASLESHLAAAQSTSQEQQLACRSAEERLAELQAEVMQLGEGERCRAPISLLGRYMTRTRS
eukprot:jgi/Tetstr1/464843/TSEL_009582.t1